MSDRKPSPVDDGRPKAKRRKQEHSALEKPKRPLSAYNLFFREERSRYLEERAAKKSQDSSGKSPFLAMSAEISKRWMSLPLDQRQKYNLMAEEETVKYHEKVDAYKAKQRGISPSVPADAKPSELEYPQGEGNHEHAALPDLFFQPVQASSYGTGGPASSPRPSMTPSSVLSPQRPARTSRNAYASPDGEDNLLLQRLLQQQLENTSGLQASLQQQLLQQLSRIPADVGVDLAALHRHSLREAAASQDDTAQLRALLEMQERIRQQQITDILEQELRRRTFLLSQQASPARNPLLQRQDQAISFLPPSGTDINNRIFSHASLLSRGDQWLPHQIEQRAAAATLQERLSMGEAKESSPFRPIRNQLGASTAGIFMSSSDDLLLRALLANQMQQGSAFSPQLSLPLGIQSSLAQQHALHGDSELIAALAQGSRVPNADDPQDSSNPSSPS
ncbi:hypothetical protein FisN_13Lh379 [Fistulifera solaris]|uniref:HMG box domain-containing protein n=1 Tax=Fistulifera solaris TaxID=1519565 RepID=A0A1Z5KM23_FISSO|nr:hypothetical protein FisN_13Lh379 [Fistulifera solaris]|eukprot:GAX27081.1 hypothetical protein FisN_13Lh379 [Fistulifera solaris]